MPSHAVIDPAKASAAAVLEEPKAAQKYDTRYAGFAAGVLSGWTKLIVGQPIDTIKTRLQCAPLGTYPGGAWECFTRTISKEGPRALYKGASAPAVGWSITDGILMGSLNNYRSFLLANGFEEPIPAGLERLSKAEDNSGKRLSLLGHCIAGTFAGWSNAPVAHFIETIKARLQLQYSLAAVPTKSTAASHPSPLPAASSSRPPATMPFVAPSGTRLMHSAAATLPAAETAIHFSGPIDVIKQTVRTKGLLGMWRGFGATIMFRANFAWMFGGFEVFRRGFDELKGTRFEMSQGASNFLAGGLASQAYWLGALPFDNVKNRLMCDSLTKPKYRGIGHAFMTVLHERDRTDRTRWRNAATGVANFYRGIIPVALRAFPTNAAALFVWERVMHHLT